MLRAPACGHISDCCLEAAVSASTERRDVWRLTRCVSALRRRAPLSSAKLHGQARSCTAACGAPAFGAAAAQAATRSPSPTHPRRQNSLFWSHPSRSRLELRRRARRRRVLGRGRHHRRLVPARALLGPSAPLSPCRPCEAVSESERKPAPVSWEESRRPSCMIMRAMWVRRRSRGSY